MDSSFWSSSFPKAFFLLHALRRKGSPSPCPCSGLKAKGRVSTSHKAPLPPLPWFSSWSNTQRHLLCLRSQAPFVLSVWKVAHWWHSSLLAKSNLARADSHLNLRQRQNGLCIKLGRWCQHFFCFVGEGGGGGDCDSAWEQGWINLVMLLKGKGPWFYPSGDVTTILSFYGSNECNVVTSTWRAASHCHRCLLSSAEKSVTPGWINNGSRGQLSILRLCHY